MSDWRFFNSHKLSVYLVTRSCRPCDRQTPSTVLFSNCRRHGRHHLHWKRYSWEDVVRPKLYPVVQLKVTRTVIFALFPQLWMGSLSISGLSQHFLAFWKGVVASTLPQTWLERDNVGRSLCVKKNNKTVKTSPRQLRNVHHTSAKSKVTDFNVACLKRLNGFTITATSLHAFIGPYSIAQAKLYSEKFMLGVVFLQHLFLSKQSSQYILLWRPGMAIKLFLAVGTLERFGYIAVFTVGWHLAD